MNRPPIKGLARARRGAFIATRERQFLTREAEEALFAKAEVLTEGSERKAKNGERSWFGSTMITFDLKQLAASWRGTFDDSVRILARTPGYWATLASELGQLPATAAALAGTRLGDLPLIVLSAGGKGDDTPEAAASRVEDAQFVIDLRTFGTEIALWDGDPATALDIASEGFDRLGEADDAVILGQLAIPAAHAAAAAWAATIGRSPGGSGFTGLVLTYVVRSKARVDEIMAEAEKAGATILKPAATQQWGGYGGSFADPDGYIWSLGYSAQGKDPP